MGIVNLKTITRAIEDMLKTAHGGDYLIVRNAERNMEPNVPSIKGAWVNVTRGDAAYTPGRVMATNPHMWTYAPTVKVEIQTASLQSADDAEDKLLDVEYAIMTTLTANMRVASGAVLQGFDIAYEYLTDGTAHVYSATITIKLEVR